jgi:glutathione-regulated potassium-efflux system ancillary protein KefC
MQEKNLGNTPAGKSAFAILLFQDMAAIPLLVVVPLLGSAHDGADFNFMSALGALILVVVIGRFLMHPALRLIAKTGVREIFTAFALLLVLGIAQMMALAHLSMGLGAFLAGVLLARSEYRKALEADLEPFKGLLLGLFFTSVGMSMNLGLLAEDPLKMIALTVGYVLVKMVLLGAMARLIPVPKVQRWPFAGVLAQGSEFAFVLFAVANGAALIPKPWHHILPLVVAMSMALTPLSVFVGEWLAQRLHARVAPPPDDIKPEEARVIIAGFGRVGQIVGRMLYASGFKVTVLDNDPDLIETLRRFGFRVFYGDATRLDLLHAAGADKADVIINAIDDMESNLRLAELVKTHFPALRMIARARNLTHLFELRERGIEVIERETFESALLIGERALRQMGFTDETAELARQKFREHNLATLDAVYPYYQDESKAISIDQTARNELAKSFEEDRIRLNKSE